MFPERYLLFQVFGCRILVIENKSHPSAPILLGLSACSGKCISRSEISAAVAHEWLFIIGFIRANPMNSPREAPDGSSVGRYL